MVEVYGKEAKLDIIVYMKDVAIRKITLKDTDKIVKWRNSPAVMNNFIVRNKLTKKQHIDWLNNKVKIGKVVQFIAVDKVNNVDFATTYLKDIDKLHKKAEFGIFIGEADYRHKNYGQLITRLTLDYAFNKLKLNKVYARVLNYNKPSYNLFKKLGFNRDAILREDVYINGHYEDVYIMSLLKFEYKK